MLCMYHYIDIERHHIIHTVHFSIQWLRMKKSLIYNIENITWFWLTNHLKSSQINPWFCTMLEHTKGKRDSVIDTDQNMTGRLGSPFHREWSIFVEYISGFFTFGTKKKTSVGLSVLIPPGCAARQRITAKYFCRPILKWLWYMYCMLINPRLRWLAH